TERGFTAGLPGPLTDRSPVVVARLGRSRTDVRCAPHGIPSAPRFLHAASAGSGGEMFPRVFPDGCRPALVDGSSSPLEQFLGVRDSGAGMDCRRSVLWKKATVWRPCAALPRYRAELLEGALDIRKMGCRHRFRVSIHDPGLLLAGRSSSLPERSGRS